MLSVKKNLAIAITRQVSNICHINNMFRTRSLSLMYCVNLAETSHTSVYYYGMVIVYLTKSKAR